MEKRINRTDMYLQFIKTVEQRSTCLRKKVGAVLVKDKRVVAMSYNGVLPGIDPKEGLDPVTGESKTVHAEANLVAFCAKEGIPTKGCHLYISLSPCVKCAELIVQAGISTVTYVEEYRDREGLEVLYNQGITICRANTKS